METFFNNRDLPREITFFGFEWEFALTDSLSPPDETALWRRVQLPHDWSTDYPVEESAPSCGSGGYVRTGIGWYRRSFSLNPKRGENISLYFEGVYMNCDVWLNGIFIGGHIYGYTSFELNLTDALRDGENEILIRVDNSHQPGSRWYTGSGITRPLYLLRTQKTHIETWGVYITTPSIEDSRATVRVETRLTGTSGRGDLCLRTSVRDNPGKICASAEDKVIPKEGVTSVQVIEVENPARWDIESPNLYTLISEIYAGEILLDHMETPFGIREIAFDKDHGFLLNGKKIILCGVCLHHDGGCVGAAVPSQVWRRRLEKLKLMGANALRCSHNPPDPALLDLADELGFVVMDEAFDEWETMKGKEFGSNTHESRGYSEWFSSCWKEDLTAMLMRDRNHPSVIIWSIGNEVREQIIPNKWKIAKELAGLCHALDPTRPVTQACDQVKAEPCAAYSEFLEQLDIVGVNYTDRWRERTETFFDEEKREHPNWLLMGTEDGSVGGVRGDYRLNQAVGFWGRNSYYSKMLKAEKLWKFIRTRPYVMGSFMWTGIDYLGECFWPDKGASSGVLDTCGFEKDGYYFYRSQWVKDEPVLYICPHLNLDLELGTVYPVVVYTNCFSAELFLDGKSYGVKAYEFPSQGMTKYYSHFERPMPPVTTSDLHLSWDVPYTNGELVVVGRDQDGKEIARQILHRTGKPVKLAVRTDRTSLSADGRDVAQLEIALLDEHDQIVPDCDLPVSLSVIGGTLLGMDNGNPSCREMYRSGKRETFHGMAYAVVQSMREAGEICVEVSAPGLDSVSVYLQTE